MNKINTEKLLKKYSSLFKKHKLPNSPMSRLFECGDGWFKIIDKLCARLVKIWPDIEAHQVKEKFASIRFYTNKPKDTQVWFRICTAINMAFIESEKTCETCGKPATLTTSNGYKSTLCNKCIIEGDK